MSAGSLFRSSDCDLSLFVGVDPGKAGGIAAVDTHGSLNCAVPMPATDRDILDLFEDLYAQGTRMVVIEGVHSMPKQGVASAFTFGAGYGGLRMALLATGLRYETVSPGKWQGAMRCRTGGDKNVSKRRAQELFPGAKVTHKVADALLLAEYARRTYG